MFAVLSLPPSPTQPPVRPTALQVDSAKQRFSVTLKPSLTATSDAALLRSLFTDLELAAELQTAQDVAAGESAINWAADVAIGSTIDVQVGVLLGGGGCTWCLWWGWLSSRCLCMYQASATMCQDTRHHSINQGAQVLTPPYPFNHPLHITLWP